MHCWRTLIRLKLALEMCSVALMHEHIVCTNSVWVKDITILIFFRVCLLKKRKTIKAFSLFLHFFCLIVPQGRGRWKAMILSIQSG